MEKMTKFTDVIRHLLHDYPYEVQVCNTAIIKERKKLEKEIRDLKIELTGIPEKGLFGEQLRKEHLDKIQSIQEKINKL